MNEKVTYILGAGASAEAVPVVNRINEIANELILLLKKLANQKTIREGSGPAFSLTNLEEFNFKFLNLKGHRLHSLCTVMLPMKDEIEKCIAHIEHIEKISFQNYSIDTYARINDLSEQELIDYKRSLSVFFLLVELFQKPDLRYQNFFATLLNGYFRASSNYDPISVINWNYDQQFELAIQQLLLKLPEFNQSSSIVHIHEDAKSKDYSPYIRHFKINGASQLLDSENHTFKTLIEKSNDAFYTSPIYFAQNINKILDYPSENHKIKFSWEIDTYFIENTVCPYIEETDRIIVIGYSFPTFNHRIDRSIFNRLLSSSNNTLDVTIQCGQGNEAVKERIQEIVADIENSEKVECVINWRLVSYTNQFYVPSSLL